LKTDLARCGYRYLSTGQKDGFCFQAVKVGSCFHAAQKPEE